MENQTLVSPDRSCSIHAVKLPIDSACSVQLVLRLGDEFRGGDLVFFSNQVKGGDEWRCGIASGALYAFRTLKIPRQHLLVEEIQCKLPSSEMEVLANCSALAIAKLAGKELPPFPDKDWMYASEIVKRIFESASTRPPVSAGKLKAMFGVPQKRESAHDESPDSH